MRELGLSPDRISFGAMVSLELLSRTSHESGSAAPACVMSGTRGHSMYSEERYVSSRQAFIVEQRMRHVEHVTWAA